MKQFLYNAKIRDHGSHARGVYPARDTSRMGTARVKLQDEIIIKDMVICIKTYYKYLKVKYRSILEQTIDTYCNLSTKWSYTGIHVYWSKDLVTYFSCVSEV